MNKRVTLVALMLIMAAVAAISAKVLSRDRALTHPLEGQLRRCSIVITAKGREDAARVKMYLPKDNERQTIYNEHLDHEGFQIEITERNVSGNRQAAWRASLLEGSRTIQYNFACHLQENRYTINPETKVADNPYADYPHEMQVWLDPSKYIQSDSRTIRHTLWKVTGNSKNMSKVVGKIYAFVRGEVQYKSEKGSKDAAATLKALEADCGGKARLFCALSRAAGIPSRIVGGIIMDPGSKKISHVWAENYIDGQWIPFDVVNNFYAMVPANYLELYRGDVALFRHFGVDKFNYLFTIDTERARPVDHAWSLYVLPVRTHGFAHFLLLIPIGALVIAFFRTIIGVPTFGTFAPILLAAAFREISVPTGLICLFTIILTGLGLRLILDKMYILGIPRLSIILTFVVIMVLCLFVFSVRYSQDKILYFSFFPMIIMTWMIERFSVAQIEDGTFNALQTAGGTALLSAALYFIFGIPALRHYLFAFPEVLLIVMGLLLMLGRYTGYRLVELIRFQDLARAMGRDHRKGGA
jgi:transglutaminase-like putative cysteine protease